MDQLPNDTEETTPQIGPVTDEDWAIHVLNIHGTFFERRCQQVVRTSPLWKLQESNYPVCHRNKESNLDIWAEAGDINRLVLPIECKKNNPDYVDWIFFCQPTHRPSLSLIQELGARRHGDDVRLWWSSQRDFIPFAHNLIIADEARETKGDYLKQKANNKTKTSNAAITEASTQIALATQALIGQESTFIQREYSEIRARDPNYFPPFRRLTFLPTIVTTAHLLSCHFEEAEIDLHRGEIPFEKVQLVERSCLLFDYPVPTTLQPTPEEIGKRYGRDALGVTARMPIFIVQSDFFPLFLTQLTKLQKLKNVIEEPFYKLDFQVEEDNHA